MDGKRFFFDFHECIFSTAIVVYLGLIFSPLKKKIKKK